MPTVQSTTYTFDSSDDIAAAFKPNTKARMQLQRDFGAYPAAHSAFMLNVSPESLDVRMRRHCENAQKVAEYLVTRDDVLNEVRYPGLVRISVGLENADDLIADIEQALAKAAE